LEVYSALFLIVFVLIVGNAIRVGFFAVFMEEAGQNVLLLLELILFFEALSKLSRKFPPFLLKPLYLLFILHYCDFCHFDFSSIGSDLSESMTISLAD